MRRRVLAFLMTLVLMVSMVPTAAFAENTGTVYQIGDTVTNDGSAQPVGATVENSHWVRKDVYDTSVLTCQKEVHDHALTPCTQVPAAVECTLAGHPTEGELTSHTHEDGKVCTYDPQQAKWFAIGNVWNCGKEAHAHSEAAGCYKLVETVWTLAAGTTEKVCEEGCILTGEEHDECFVWVACTKTEGCELADGHEDDCSGISGYADTEYTVTLRARRGSSRLRMVEIMITDAEGNTLDYITTNNNGNATIDLPDGTYNAYISYTSGNYDYEGELEFTVNGEDAEYTIDVTREVSENYGKTIYDNTTYFNHVDIRVKGTYTTGTTTDLTTYNIKLQNVSIVIDNKGASGYENYYQSFSDNSETYEWRKTGIKVSKGAVVTLTCDIVNSATGETMKSGFTHSFSGEADFIQAILNCDANQGLDFIIDPQEIIEAVAHEVSYQWAVVDANGNVTTQTIPANVATLPGTTTGYKDGASHTINTLYHEGTYVIVESDDGSTATAYQFYGWDWWSHTDDNNLTKNPVGSSETTLTVTDDTIVYGVWRTFELEKATSHLTITKEFSGNEGKLPADYTIVVTGPLGGDYDIPLSMFTDTDGDGIYTYNMPVYTEGTFTIKEESYTIDGYELSNAVVTVTDSTDAGHEHLTEVAGSNTGTSVQVQVELHWKEAGTEDVSTTDETQHDYLGTVDFVNTYAKTEGEPIYNLPNLHIDKLDAADRSVLEGATFELRDEAGKVIYTGTSDESGYISFNNIPVDTTKKETVYYLVETTAPAGYVKDNAQHKIVITEKTGSPTQILQDGKWHDYHQYDMNVQVSLDGGNTWEDSQHFSVGTTGSRFRLAVFNFKIDGQLTINKTISGLVDENGNPNTTVYPDAIIVKVQGKNTGYDEVITINKGLDAAGNVVYNTTLTGLELDTYYVLETGIVIGGKEVSLLGGEYAIDGYFFDGVTYQVTKGTAAQDSPNQNGVVLSENDLVAGDDYTAAVSVSLTNNYIRLEDDTFVWPTLEILKKRDSNGEPIQGVEFTLYYGGQAQGTVTTGVNGLAIINFADYATALERLVSALGNPDEIVFTMKETKEADGYAKNDTVYQVVLYHVGSDETLTDGVHLTKHTYFVKVIEGNTTTSASTVLTHFTVENTKDEGSLTIKKTFGADNAYVPVSISVQIMTGGNIYETVELSAENNWTYVLENIPLGDYGVTEMSMVTHEGKTFYLTGSNVSVTDKGVTYYLHSSSVSYGNATLTSENENGTVGLSNIFTREVINPASFQVKKIGEDGAILRNATFALYTDESCTGNAIMTESTGADGVATFVGFTEEATYYLKETVAPAGYYLDDTIWEVKVELENGEPTIKINEHANVWESIFNWVASIFGKDNGHWNNGVLTVMNTVNTGLNIVKQDIGDGSAVPGAGFTLYSDSTCQTPVGTERIADENGKLNLPITASGTYYLKETTTPAGYLESGAVYTVVAEFKNETVTLDGTSYTVPKLHLSIAGVPTIPVDGVEHYAIFNEKLVSIDVEKVWTDSDFHDRPGEVTVALLRNGTEVDTVILNASNSWKYTWESYEVNGVDVPLTNAFTWTIEEKDDFSDLGYEDPVYVGEADEWKIVNARNINLIDVTVTKEWVLNGDHHKAPESVTVQLRANDQLYDEIILNAVNNWTCTWENLSDAYEWTVVEDNVDGYKQKSIEVDEANNGDLEFTIVNERIINDVEITVNKEWVNGEKDKKVTFPTSVKVALYKDGVKVETVTLNAGNDWTCTWDDLTDEHEWKVDEPSVPSGYIKTIKVTSKETNSGSEYTYDITNTYNSNPKTGDFSNIGMWGMGMMVPVLALFVLMLGGTRKKGKYEA